MPIQVWTNPRADLNTLAGGRALAEGVASLGNLGDAIERAMEKKKQENELVNVLRKKHSLLQPDRKMEFNQMNKAELIGEDKAFVAKAIERDQQQKLDVEKAQLAHYLEQQAQAKAAPAFFQRLAESGQKPENVPAPVNNAEFDRRTAPLDARAMFEAAGATGYNPAGQADDLLRAIESGRGKTVALPPGFVPKSATINGVTYGNPKDEKQTLEDHPWLYDDDMEKVKQGIRAIKDPQQRQLAIKARNDYEVMQGRPSILEQFFLGAMGGKGGQGGGGRSAAGSQPAAPQFNKGDRAKQNGIIYEFDGKDWQPVQ